MLISNVHKSIIVMNSSVTRFSRNIFEAVQKFRSACFTGSKSTRLRLVVLNPDKNCCSCFKHYCNEAIAGVKGFNGTDGNDLGTLVLMENV